jgi:hypothetical protein
MSQLTKITFGRGVVRYFKWPYQENVMKMFEMVSSTIVVILSSCPIGRRFAKPLGRRLGR